MPKDAGGGLPWGYAKQRSISGGKPGGSLSGPQTPAPKGNSGQHLGYNRAKPKGGSKGVNPSDFNQRSGKK